MGKGRSIINDLFSDIITELPSIIGIANLQRTMSGPKSAPTTDGNSRVEKEKEIPTNPFSKEDEAVFSQLERLLEPPDFDTLSRLFDVLEPHQVDDFRYYIVKQNQTYAQVVKSRKAVRTGATQKSPEKDEVFEEFDFSLTANLYGPEDVRVKYLEFVAKKIRELDKSMTGNGAEEVKRLLIRRRLIRERSVQQEALETAGKAKDLLKKGERRLYRLLLTKKLGSEYRELLNRFLESHPGLTEEDAWKRHDFVIDILTKRAMELKESK